MPSPPSIIFFLATGILMVVTYVGTQHSVSPVHEALRRIASPKFNTSSTTPTTVYGEIYKKWKKCVDPLMKNPEFDNAANFWNNIREIVSECATHLEKLMVKPYHNSDETKYHILPKEKEGKSVIISLGVGKDIKAEERLKQALGNESVEFFGADPIVEVNQKLYESIGQFFPFAISADAGVLKASVFIGAEYLDKQVVNIDAIYFLKNFVKRQFIDDLLLDAEYAEYGLFSYFYKNGLFDLNGFTFCQINMEIHLPSEQQKELTRDFFFRILEDERYAILKIVRGSHLRVYMVNFEDPTCANKYLPTI